MGDLGDAVGSGEPEGASEEDSGVDSAEVEGEVRMEVEMEVTMEELPEEASEAAVRVSAEAEASEEGKAGAVVVKAEAGEVTAEPLRARAKLKLFLLPAKPPLSTSLHHISTKNLSPSGACSRPPPLLSF